MANMRKKMELAAILRETPENTRNGQSQSTLDAEMAQKYFSQVSEEIDERVTEKPSKDISWTESRILGALSKLDHFFLRPTSSNCSEAVPGTSRNYDSENRESTGDRSLDDPYPDVRFSPHHSGNLDNPELEDYPHMVTGGQEKVRQYIHMTIGTQEEITYCSTGTSSGKQKKARSTSQPQFRSENTPATIEADQILLTLQQLATKSNSANFNNKISRILKLSKFSQQQYPRLMESQRKSKYLKICSKQVWKSTTSWQRRTK